MGRLFFAGTSVLFGLRSADRADVGAVAAVDAGSRIDDVLAVAFGNRVNGAFSLAGAAADAIIRNLVCHGFTSRYRNGGSRQSGHRSHTSYHE